MNDETLFLYFNNELIQKEKESVEKWIKKHPEEYQKVKVIWEKFVIDQSSVKPNLKKMWGNINSKIDTPKDKKYRKLPFYKSMLKYAAIFILGIGLLGYFANKKINNPIWVEYTSTIDKNKDFVLPDGSTVTLNKTSTLYYKKQFLSSTREVNLKGEAFFQVIKNPRKPFLINVNNTQVKVLGTSFNVNALDTLGKIIVSVESGRVMFYDKGDTSNVVYLSKGDMGIFSSHQQIIKKSGILNKNYLAWKTGILLFKNKFLVEVCEVLSEYYDINIVVNHSVLKEKQLTARYENKSLPEVLDLLTMALDINYIREGDTVFLNVN